MGFTFDYLEALERVGGDRELLREVAGIFATDAPAMMAAIAEAIAQRDPQAIFRTAHRLKGAVANFSARGAMAAAALLERIGAAGSVEGAEQAFDRLEPEIDRVGKALADFAARDFVEGFDSSSA